MEKIKNSQKEFSLRINCKDWEKIRYIAHYYDQSLNRLLNYAVRLYIQNFERKVEKINLDDLL